MVYDNHKIIVCLNNSESNYTFFLDGTYKDIFVDERYEGEIEIESHDCAVLYEENFDFKTIKVKEKMQTNIPGIYACVDCTGGLLQISKAVYEGTIAGLEVIKYVKQNI